MMSNAVREYLAKLPQMGAGKAALHVTQKYGITPRELREAIITERRYVVVENEPERLTVR